LGETNPLSGGIGPKHPGDLFHVVHRRVLSIHVPRTKGHRERDPGCERMALDDFIGEPRATGDGRATAGMTQRWVPFVRRPTVNLDVHGGLLNYVVRIIGTSFLFVDDDDAIVWARRQG
jgi:hypothetical protein